MDINLVVPGHGPVRKKKDALEPMISYFDRLVKNIRGFHKKKLFTISGN